MAGEEQDEQAPSGGPVNINVRVEDPGILVIHFDRALDTMILQPIEAVQLAQVLLQKALAAMQGVVDSRILRVH